ncbi:hypothetical protein CGMCC3_g5387 [Colletotrichum fructicola]|nr:uncharacterized protein CGMCC3_g5387 [Colletotrichum fructicola]KAE9578331.1 hypothetical protein CGMCC3_g5387 [Colletotrichum fructicola]
MANPPQDFEVQVAADEEPQDDSRSEMGSSIASSSTSLRSSLLDYRRENGRTYHRYKDGKYNFPNDERELDRLDLVHHLCLLTLDDRLGIAPPCREDAKAGRVLDVGTGTGIWAIHFGDDHPEADILGVDLSATQPGHVPPNVREGNDRNIHAYWPQHILVGRKPVKETPAPAPEASPAPASAPAPAAA